MKKHLGNIARRSHACRSRYAVWGKRLFDLSVAVPAIIVLSPLLVLLAALIRWKLGTPVIFRQERPGLDGKTFEIMKFRTMTEARGAAGGHLPDDDRRTPLGEFLRNTSLDELPELFNVLRGEMSLVGPRPLLMRYLGRYSAEQERRHDARPGITGWAQVNGRNAQSWERKFALDVWYVDHQSLLLDLFILWRTVVTVLERTGIPSPEIEFLGSDPESEARAAAEVEQLTCLRATRRSGRELKAGGIG